MRRSEEAKGEQRDTREGEERGRECEEEPGSEGGGSGTRGKGKNGEESVRRSEMGRGGNGTERKGKNEEEDGKGKGHPRTMLSPFRLPMAMVFSITVLNVSSWDITKSWSNPVIR